MSVADRKERGQRFRKRVSLHFGTGAPTSGGFTTNVSAWGLSMTAPSIHAPGTRLQIEVRLATGNVARLTARVRWARRGTPALGIPNSMGVRLETADEGWFAFVSALGDPKHELVPPPEAMAPTPAPAPVTGKEKTRRVLVRHPVSWLVRFGLGEKLDMAGTTLDVSAMGVAVSTPTLPAPGTGLFLEVSLPGSAVVRCEGVVLRARRLSVAERKPNAMAVRLSRADEAWYRAVLALDRAQRGG